MKPMLRVLFITGVAGAGAVALFLLIFIHPRDPALTNQNEILGLLGRASPVPTSRLNLEVRSVVLAERITLFPGRTQAVFGYSLRLTVRSTNFTIDAEPLIPGKTGVYSFLRDEAGNIRFEPILGKPASERSRLWNR